MSKTKKKKAKVSVSKFVCLVSWEESGDDPLKEFKTLEEAKAFATDILQNGTDNYCAEDISGVKVYKAQVVGKAKLSVVFSE